MTSGRFRDDHAFITARLSVLIPGEALLPKGSKRVAARSLQDHFGCLEKC